MWAERCQGCGDCLLGVTGGICPIARCSKRLMNGPCGGSTSGKCEINPEVDCAWQLIWDRLKALGLEDRYEEIIAGQGLANRPGWRPPKNHQRGFGRMKTESVLEKILKAGNLAVTSECGPPRGAVPEKVREKAELLRRVMWTPSMSPTTRRPWSACPALPPVSSSGRWGCIPILQMVTRDRNRLAMQSDILGAYAHGINTMLCLSGDHPHFGDHPMAANVHDIDSIQFIQMVKKMRDEGKFQGGEDIENPPKMFIGAAANPFADPFELRVARLAKKVEAGADFIQTQCIYNLEKFEKWMEGVRDRGLHEKCYILAGITPLKSVGMARYMKNKVPGMDVPDEVVNRMAGVPKEKQAEEGIQICVETIERLKQVKGVAGFHIMAIEWEQKVPEIVERAGLYPRPMSTGPVKDSRCQVQRRFAMSDSNLKSKEGEKTMNDKKLILVVDDDPDLVEAVALKLESENFRVTKAYDGVEALDQIKKERPALVILDVMMPRKNGYELCEELKKSDEYKDIIVLLLTAVGDAVTSTNYTHWDGKTTLADDYIPKPIDLEKLMGIVKDYLG